MTVILYLFLTFICDNHHIEGEVETNDDDESSSEDNLDQIEEKDIDL